MTSNFKQNNIKKNLAPRTPSYTPHPAHPDRVRRSLVRRLERSRGVETICFVAAHSGGHIIPCATLAAKLALDHQILFITINQKLEREILAKYNFITKINYLELPKFPYRKFWHYPKFIFQFIKTILNSRKILRTTQVTRVITTGGISAIPVCLAAKSLQIPIELYELNLEPGKTITFLAPLANKIKLCFAETKNFLPKSVQNKCELVDYPVRFTATDILTPDQKKLILAQHSLIPARPTIFILGGSQGSAFLNHLALQLTPIANQIQVIHQTGPDLNIIAQLTQFYAQHQIPAYLFAYTHEIAQLYNSADIIITRAGAGVLAEILFFKKPAIVIPLKTGTTSHQVANACALAKQHPELFTVLDQDQVAHNTQLLLTAITTIHPNTP